MRHTIRGLLVSILLVTITACSGVPGLGRGAPGPGASTASATLSGDQLRGASANLLAALRSRMRGMQVRENSDACPQITLRGTSSMFGDNNPVVYVDGIRTSSTCILNTLAIMEVDRVEVYSNGVAPRPPYKSHPNGLILVFMEQGVTDQ